MMIEYIDREALLKDIEDSVRFTSKTGTISPEMRGANKIIDRIKCAPATDVEPVRHGRWEWVIEDIYRCNNCAERSHVKEVMGHPDWDYCPNCGARMDERKDK